MNPRCYGLSQISYLVATINKKNYKGNTTEISSLVDKYGSEGEKHLFRCLVSQVDFSNGDGLRTMSNKDGQQLQLLINEAMAIITRRNFTSILCHGFENQDNKTLRPVNQMIPSVAKVLKLSRVAEVVFALGLKESSQTDIRNHASNHLKSKLPNLIRSYSDLGSGFEGGLGDVAIEVLHMLLCHILQHTEDQLSIPSDTVELFIQALRRDFPQDRVPVILAPLLYREHLDITEDRLIPVTATLPSSVSSIELADIIKDVGYSATATKQDMLEILKDFGKVNISPGVVARVLGMMSQTHSNLPESIPYLSVNNDPSRMGTKSPAGWDPKVFATALQSLVPNLCWRDVVPEMDYEGFHVPTTEGLNIIMTAFNIGSKDPFPIEMIYEPWIHTKGQLSWFQQALTSGSEFNFYNYHFNPVNLEALKTTYLVEEAKTWRSLSLIETLLNLAEQGHYYEVLQLFKTPIRQCPEVFFLGLLQSKVTLYDIM
jgi:CCR4-NOT transcription complex subunit 1